MVVRAPVWAGCCVRKGSGRKHDKDGTRTLRQNRCRSVIFTAKMDAYSRTNIKKTQDDMARLSKVIPSLSHLGALHSTVSFRCVHHACVRLSTEHIVFICLSS